MSELATYTFLPWLRQGIANQISGTTGNRATIPIDLSITGDTVEGEGQQSSVISKDIQIYGPGDITGIDSKAIVKVEPRNGITNFETNYLPYIEFYDEDFPWRYSPLANPTTGSHRLKPWLALIVLKESEFTNGKNIKDKPLPYIQLEAGAQLQSLDEAWAWGHVHVNRSLVKQEDQMIENDQEYVVKELEKLLNKNPDLAYSRIVCPRRLEEKESYYAFLVPTFESGRKAGLGEDPSTASFDEPAWDVSTINGRHLPYYHRWYFKTGTVGDFEYLVRLLEPKPVDSRVGVRDVDVQNPGANLTGIQDADLKGILRLGGALRVPESSQKDLATAKKYEYWAFRGDLSDADILNLEIATQPLNLTSLHPFQKSIASFINLADDYQDQNAATVNQLAAIDQQTDADPNNPKEYDIKNNPDPIITAPLYGRWHALTQRLVEQGNGDPISNNYNWVHELNLDPRWRVSAGIGTKIVQENQEDYMKAAWEQIGDVLTANKKIREAQLAKVVSEIWYEKHLKPIREKRPDKWLNLTSPLHNRIVSKGVHVFYQGSTNHLKEPTEYVHTTIAYQKSESKLTSAFTSVNMRKLMRPRGKFIKRLPFSETIGPENLLERINTGQVSAAPPREVPEGIQKVNDLVEASRDAGIPDFLVELLDKHPWIKWVILILAIILLLAGFVFSLSAGASATLVVVAVGLFYLYRKIDKWTKNQGAVDQMMEENQTPEVIDQLPKSPDFRVSTPEEKFKPTFKGSIDSQEGIRFKTALKEANTMYEETAKAGIVMERPSLELEKISATIYENIAPKLTIPRWVYAGVLLPRFIIDQMKETFVEVMTYPKFDLPMYKPLADYSAELFLPNINFIDQNSISLLETNQKFIESYMVGLNHEFSRELLWREYLTDQRGSYFRQFWEVNGLLDRIPLSVATLKSRYKKVIDDRYIADLQEIYELLNDTSVTHDEDFLQKAHDKIFKEELKDIKPLHYWSKSSRLGEHDNRELPGETEEELVLVIRGELLKKYPTAVIYAHRAQWQTKEVNGETVIDNTQERTLVELNLNDGDTLPPDKIKSPLYEAKVDPDIYFFGFDLTTVDAKGGDGSSPEDDPGWFFVIKERPGEPRFGLDIKETTSLENDKIELWNDLSWSDLKPEVPKGGFIRIDSSPMITANQTLETDDQEKEVQQDDDQQVNWSSDMNAAELAYILYQVPVLVAVHASEMLVD